MRVLAIITGLTFTGLAILAGGATAHAEKRMFIIANDTTGRLIERCLANGGGCGKIAATAYCRSRDYTAAVSFRKVDRDDITGSIPAGGACPGKNCDDFIAIECSR